MYFIFIQVFQTSRLSETFHPASAENDTVCWTENVGPFLGVSVPLLDLQLQGLQRKENGSMQEGVCRVVDLCHRRGYL